MSAPAILPQHPDHICQQSKSVVNGAAKAFSCALDLAERGFVILTINIEGERPTVILQPDERIHTELKAGPHIIRPAIDGGRDEIYATHHKEWSCG